jgi:hypothetical protein
LTGIFILLKLWNRRGFVRLGMTVDDLFNVTNGFERNSDLPLLPDERVEMMDLPHH